MKKSLPWYVVVPVLLAVFGACGYYYSRMPMQPPPAKVAPPTKLGFNPRKLKQEKLKAQEAAKSAKEKSAMDATKKAPTKDAEKGTGSD